MTVFSRSTILLAAAASLVAQSSPDVLKWVPAKVRLAEVTLNPAAAEAKYAKTMAQLDPGGTLLGLSGKAHLSVKDLSAGPVVVATFPSDQPATPGVKAATKKEPSWEVVFAPVKDAKATAAKLKVQGEGAVRHYRWMDGKAEQTRYIAFRGGYAVIGARKALLEQVMKGGPALDAEFGPLMPWLAAHDSTVVVTASGTEKGIADFSGGMQMGLTSQPGASPSQAWMANRMKAWMDKASVSVHHLALALDLQEEGGLKVVGRAFFKPGSPLAQEAAQSKPLAGGLLGALPEGPFAFAMGSQWPGFLAVFNELALQDPALTEAQRASLKTNLDQQAAQMESMAFSLEPPAAGKPFLSGCTTVLGVKDVTAWAQASAAQQKAMMERMGEAYGVENSDLDGRPCTTIRVDLGALTQGKIPPAQLAMFSTLLFGGPRMAFSQIALDDHTVLAVMGDKDILRRAVARAKEGKRLSASAGIKKVDAELPQGGRVALYAHPKGLHDLATSIFSAMGLPSGKPLELGDVAPLGGVVTVDAAGAEFSGVAKVDTLKAFGQVFKTLGEAFPKPKLDVPAEAPAEGDESGKREE